jgi:hypothetical protein
VKLDGQRRELVKEQNGEPLKAGQQGQGGGGQAAQQAGTRLQPVSKWDVRDVTWRWPGSCTSQSSLPAGRR